MDLIALGFALVVVWLARLLRAMGAFRFERHSAEWTDERPDEALAPLFQKSFAEARALGYADPRWVEVRSDYDGGATIFAVLAHPDGGLLWLAPPVYAWKIERLFTLATSRLQDGRSAYSQNFDTFFAACPTDEIDGRAGGEADLANFVAEHRAFVAGLGSPPIVEDDATTLDQYGGALERHRQALIADGRLEPVTDTLALPRLRLAVTLLRAFLKIPKAPQEKGPFAPELLAAHVPRAEQIAARAPLRSIELALLVSSIVAFAIAGAILWEPALALILLAVIVIHELGHYAAMRAMGYDNVHFLALPLVGGVTMGRDASPSANKQVWMSLMGPLPGIAIGAVLLVVAMVKGDMDPASPLMLGGLMFAGVNYLNLVPVPPLDGAKVLEGMLPPRFAKVQTVVFTLITIVAGVACVFGGLWLLAAIAGLQLLSVKRRWRLHDVEADLARMAPPGRAHDAIPAIVVLEAIERRLGPADSIKRVNEAVAVRDRLRTQPMGWGGRFFAGGVYSAAVAAPIALVIAALGMNWFLDNNDFAGDVEFSEEVAARASAMSMRELLVTVTGTSAPAAATPEAIAAAEARLGHALPAEVAELYAAADGVPALSIAAVEDLRGATREDLERVAPGMYEGDVQIAALDPTRVLCLGSGGVTTLFWREPDPALGGDRLVVGDETYAGRFVSLRAKLEAEAAGALYSRRLMKRERERQDANRDALRAEPFEVVLDRALEATKGTWFFKVERGEPATAEALRSAESRLGVGLPSQLSAIYLRHDPPELFGVLPSAELVRVEDVEVEFFREGLTTTSTRGFGVPIVLPPDEALVDCVLVVGFRTPKGSYMPSLLWCPSRPAETRWIEVAPQRGYAELREWLIERAVKVIR